MSKLFSPLKIGSIEFPNRIGLSPMCQYSSIDGNPGQWHFVHLGSRAVGGAGLIIMEATAVVPEGRITPEDLGLWNETQLAGFKNITAFISQNGCIPAIQLAHAGKKASSYSPWRGKGHIPIIKGGWEVTGPDKVPFDSATAIPLQMSESQIFEMAGHFAKAAQLAEKAGFLCIELHMAHGYLLHSFLSALMNLRKDDFGGSLKNRMRFPLMVAERVRNTISSDMPLFVRISTTDWAPGGWDLRQSIEFCGLLKDIGVDLIDCSSGGAVPNLITPSEPGFQVHFASEIRKETGLKTAAVGLITEPAQAEEIIANGHADIVLLGRELLRNPYWPLQAAKILNTQIQWPIQYQRAN